ncbi:MAG: UTP--glucose-1-phosphate uridylyltransferase [Myxococcales bacterium]|nr:UTP--glucose-1-phosphate uridylyltransferase [Myxococcales bacterium]
MAATAVPMVAGFPLRDSGALSRFRSQGGKVLTMSNVDNLGATLAPGVIGADLASGNEMTVEVVERRPGEPGGAPARVGGKLQIVEDFRFPQGFSLDSSGEDQPHAVAHASRHRQTLDHPLEELLERPSRVARPHHGLLQGPVEQRREQHRVARQLVSCLQLVNRAQPLPQPGSPFGLVVQVGAELGQYDAQHTDVPRQVDQRRRALLLCLCPGRAPAAASRRYLVLASDLMIVGATHNGVGLESFLSQIRQRSGQLATLGFRFGAEGEPIERWLKMRAGTYFEPSRFRQRRLPRARRLTG